MRHFRIFRILVFSFSLVNILPVAAQSWNFIKEKDCIKLYTKEEAGKSFKSFRGVTDINAPAERIFTILEDINHTEWWDKNLTLSKILLYEENKRAQYYLIYNLPWPVVDRDLCVEVTITVDHITEEHKINVVSNSGLIPERNDKVRIKDYRETWIVKPLSEGKSHVVLEGNIDPAGKIPDWLANLLIVESPFKTMTGLRDRLLKTD